jgi:hypothetical protein
MASQGSQFSSELEFRLREGLSVLRAVASEMGAKGFSVFLLKDRRTMRNLSMWPESSMHGAEVKLEPALGDTFGTVSGYVREESPVTKFLKAAFQQAGASFLLFSFGMDRLKTVIAFGFDESSGRISSAGSEMPCSVSLAALATWSVYEVFRLHSELVIVNERLGTRKLIERAKGMLQAERGLDEQQAYAHLRRLSRQRRMRMSEIASDLLRSSRFP